MRNLTNASNIWNALHGILCVHKPRDMSLGALKRYLVSRICENANGLCLPAQIPLMEVPIVEPHPVSQAPVVVGLRKQPDYKYCKRYLPLGCCIATVSFD
ncbi:unnamed protein product [Thelazia callipaeda]|uniref:Uncharacterized protein n=1 Tax=Thelazia callipaeda TaxID=103827 RepID=A0A0N5CQH5_THECL|nr:unnamed protein product [Thelazia callipaeda]